MKYKISSAVCCVQYTCTVCAVFSERMDPFSCQVLSPFQLEATGASGEWNSYTDWQSGSLDGSLTMQELDWQSDKLTFSLAV